MNICHIHVKNIIQYQGIKKGMDCGGCQHFLKLKNDRYGGGICLSYDARTKTDHGHKCKYFKAIPYNRKREAKREMIEIQSYYRQSLDSHFLLLHK